MSDGTYLNNIQPVLFYDEASIAAAGTVSTAVDLQGRALVQISMPAAISGTAFTFQSSRDNVTYQACLSEAGTAITVTYVAANNVMVDPNKLLGARYIKLVSNNAQAAAKLIGVISRITG